MIDKVPTSYCVFLYKAYVSYCRKYFIKLCTRKKLCITMDIQEVVSIKEIIDPINEYTQIVF